MSLRHPRAFLVTGGGQIVPTSVEVTQNTMQSSDTFRAMLPMYAPGVDVAYWADESPIDARVIVNGITLFDGQVDHVDMDFMQGTISVSGRDKSAKMIDKKSIESFKNKSPGNIVQEIAGRHGISVVTDDAGTEKAGKQYQIDFARIGDHVSEWSMVQHLADREGKVAFLKGSKLYYVDPGFQSPGNYLITYVRPTPVSHANGNFTALHFRRNVELGRGVKVKVASWHSKIKEKVEATSGDDGGREYEFSHPQLGQKQAQRIADKRHAEATRHEVEMTADVPGDATIDVLGMVAVVGTGTSFDHSYFLSSVHHRLSQDGGYRMTIASKNKKKGKGKKRGGR